VARIEIGDAERRQRADDGVHDGGERADIAGLARPLIVAAVMRLKTSFKRRTCWA
jgi:hypothetical protein